MDVASARSKKRVNKIKHSKLKKNGRQNGSNDEVSCYGSDDDCASVSSFASSLDSTFTLDDADDGFDHHEDFESLFDDNLEGSGQKNSKSRQKCLNEVSKALSRRYMIDIVLSRKETILDLVEKLMKRGQTEDRIYASSIASALCVQLGEGESERVFTTLKPILIPLINDDSVSSSARAAMASALGMCCFIGAEEIEDTVECLCALKNVFTKKIPSDPTHHITLTNAILSWGLILSVANRSVFSNQIDGIVSTTCKLLERGELNLRIAVGETIALVFELAENREISLSDGPIEELYDFLRELANESGRHKSKREKRQQKASFRDISKSVEDGLPPDEQIRFGLEYIQMTSWTWLCRYNRFKETLGSGTNIHLESNMLLRDIFELGIPVSKGLKENKSEKMERQWLNAASTKIRHQTRNQKRDTKHADF